MLYSKLIYSITVALVAAFFSTGCDKKNEQAEVGDQYLVSATAIGNYSTQELERRIRAEGFNTPLIASLTKHGVKAYRIVYNTRDLNNNPIQASGALLVPQTQEPLPLISIQHGTITSDQSAPSNGGEAWMGAMLATTGYVVVAPDYIGYGASKNLPHPYEHAGSLASASVDMLRAARDFMKKNNVEWDKRLFLTGYSEGGYATMALHKQLEEKHADEFTVTASAPGAGAYNKTAFAKYIFNSNKPLKFINTYLWVLDTYNKVYKLNKPWNYYLTEPNASRVKNGGVSASVNQRPNELFTTQFRESVLNGSNTGFVEALKDNDIYDWKPKAPINLFHGTADDFVIFDNSQQAYNAMKARGAKVELTPISGGNHFTSVEGYVLGMFLYFQSFNE